MIAMIHADSMLKRHCTVYNKIVIPSRSLLQSRPLRIDRSGLDYNIPLWICRSSGKPPIRIYGLGSFSMIRLFDFYVFLHFGAKTLFYAWKYIPVFALKPLISKDSLVLKISQLLLKTTSTYDLNRIGYKPWTRWYTWLFGVWITPVYTFSTPYFCHSFDLKSEWNGVSKRAKVS